MGTTAAAGHVEAGRPSVLHRWPTAVGLAAAVSVLASVASRETAAITVCVAALCYLGAAALQRPWVAWAGIPGFSLVVVGAELIGLAWWGGIGVSAVAVIALGLLSGARRPVLTAQTAALVGFGVLAVAAVLIAPRIGMVLAGLTLASHAVWDLIHYRRREVVPRSLAECCMALDVPLGLGVVVLAFVG